MRSQMRSLTTWAVNSVWSRRRRGETCWRCGASPTQQRTGWRTAHGATTLSDVFHVSVDRARMLELVSACRLNDGLPLANDDDDMRQTDTPWKASHMSRILQHKKCASSFWRTNARRARTALCSAVLARSDTVAMASTIPWPVSEHQRWDTRRCPLGASQQKNDPLRKRFTCKVCFGLEIKSASRQPRPSAKGLPWQHTIQTDGREEIVQHHREDENHCGEGV